jgi:hypothetical protein
MSNEIDVQQNQPQTESTPKRRGRKPKNIINHTYYEKNRNKYLNHHKMAYRLRKLNVYEQYLDQIKDIQDDAPFCVSRNYGQERARIKRRIDKLRELINQHEQTKE